MASAARPRVFQRAPDDDPCQQSARKNGTEDYQRKMGTEGKEPPVTCAQVCGEMARMLAVDNAGGRGVPCHNGRRPSVYLPGDEV